MLHKLLAIKSKVKQCTKPNQPGYSACLYNKNKKLSIF